MRFIASGALGERRGPEIDSSGRWHSLNPSGVESSPHQVGALSAAFTRHSSKVAGRPSSSRCASSGGVPLSRMQRARISLVERTNDTGCVFRIKIHCKGSLASDQSPETRKILSLNSWLPLLLRVRSSGAGGVQSVHLGHVLGRHGVNSFFRPDRR